MVVPAEAVPANDENTVLGPAYVELLVADLLGMMLVLLILDSMASASMLVVTGFVSCLHLLVTEKMIANLTLESSLMAPSASVEKIVVETVAETTVMVAAFEAADFAWASG